MRALNSAVLACSCVVGEALQCLLMAVDLRQRGQQALDGAFVGRAEDFGECVVEHGRSFA